MLYSFICAANHTQDIQMSIEDFDNLPRDEDGNKFVPCNVKFGDMEYPQCDKPALRQFGDFGFNMNYKGGRH